MIVRMMKYDIVLLRTEYEAFMERLRDLGMVDLTVGGWEPTEEDRRTLQALDLREKALERLERFAASEGYVAGVKSDIEDVYSRYAEVDEELSSVQTRLSALERDRNEWSKWGEFSSSKISSLIRSGISLRFFVASASTFDSKRETWESTADIVEVSRTEGFVRFLSLQAPDFEPGVTELQCPEADAGELEKMADDGLKRQKELLAELSAVADSRSGLREEICRLKHRIQNIKVNSSADRAAEDNLLVIEGWAEKENSGKVDSALDAVPGVYYIKSDPKPEDNTPVKLKNSKFVSMFELIGSMYALPKYGRIDLTPFFAPFYMLFFAICLNDAGYGAIIFLAGLLLLRRGGGMKRIGYLSLICGGATVAFGLFTGSLFGMSLSDMLGYESVEASPFFDFQNRFFSVALAIGVVQILLGMGINIFVTSHAFGFRYALGSLGWFLLLVAGCLAAGLQMLNPAWVIPGFTASSPAFLAVCGVALILMLFFNSPDKNIFANFGAGIWNTYNNITGLLSDVLSYIRLFAIGLSGGVLALVFNDLAFGLTGLENAASQPWWAVVLEALGAAIIILIGHGINLFMSTISSFVHPMRLTFVEFYKNAGFEMATRTFDPIKRENE